MQRIIIISVLALLALPAFAAPDGPPFYDPDRSLDKQKTAGKEAKALVRSAGPREVLPLFADVSVRVRDDVLNALVERNDAELLGSMEKFLGHRDPFVAGTIAELYGLCKFKEGREALEKYGLKSKSEHAALETIWALEAIGDPASGKALEKAHKKRHGGSEYRVQGDALIALAVCDPERAKPHIEKALGKKNPAMQIAALEAQQRIDPRAAAAAAVGVIESKEKKKGWTSRLLFAALDILTRWHARSKDPALFGQAVETLIDRLPKAEALSKHLIAQTLADLTGSPLGDDAEIWTSWWEPRKDGFTPVDKVVKKKTKKKKKKKKKGDKDPVGGDDDAKKGVETGGGTRVRFHGIPIYSNRMIFAQDVSGGMTMEKVDNADPSSPTRMKFSTDELKRVLGKLPDDVMTNIVFFATIYKSTAESLFPIKKARGKLLDYVTQEAVTPKGRAMSRSNLYDTLVFCLNDPEIDTVYFLSEGGPSSGRYLDTTRFMRHLARLNVYRRVQVHTLQVSSTSWGEKFLRALSETTGGKFYGLDFLRKAK